MAGSTLGNLFTITTWGESHGAAIGVVIDGCPAGLSLDEEDIQIDVYKRQVYSQRMIWKHFHTFYVIKFLYEIMQFP